MDPIRGLALLPILTAPAFSQAHVLVVNSAGGAPFTDIQAAVDAALPDDVVLVKSGSYAPFVIANKSISIAGDVGSTVQVNGTVQVRNLASDRTVLLHHLRSLGVTSASPNDGPGITLKNDLGSVRVQDCLAQGASGLPGSPGVRIENSSDVALSELQAIGGVGGQPGPFYSADGVHGETCNLAVYSTDLYGGDGWFATGTNAPGCWGGSGGDALHCTTSSFLCCAGSLLHGGIGRNGNDGCPPANYCCYGGYGGDALDIGSPLASPSTLWRLGNTAQPGAAGAGGHGSCGCGLVSTCDCDSGNVGLALVYYPSDTVVSLTGASPELSVSANPVRELTTLGITIDSAPGDQVFLAVSTLTVFQQQSGKGVRLVGSTRPHLFQIVGTTDPLGHLQDGWAIPDLGAGVQSRVLHLQALVRHTNGQLVWSNPVHLVLLDQAF